MTGATISRKGIKRSMTKRRRKELVFVLLMVAIPVIQFCIFWVYVNFDSIIMGFKDEMGEWTLANFERFLKDFRKGVISQAMINSLINLAVAEFLTLPLIVTLSYLLYKKCYGSAVFRVLFYMPSLIGSVVMTALFALMVTPYGFNPGPVLTVLQKLGVKFSPDLLKYGLLGTNDTAFATIMIYCLWTGVGVNLVLLSGALARAPQDLFEAAKIDGAGMFSEFWYVVVPVLWPTITTLFIFNLAGCFIMYMPVMLLTNGEYATQTVGFYIINHTIQSKGNTTGLGYPAAVGLVFTAITMPIILFVKWGFNKLSEAIEF